MQQGSVAKNQEQYRKGRYRKRYSRERNLQRVKATKYIQNILTRYEDKNTEVLSHVLV